MVKSRMETAMNEATGNGTFSRLALVAPVAGPGAGAPDPETLKAWYRIMHMGRVLDEKAPNYLKQAIGWSYHAPCAGHDGIQLALGLSFRPRMDYLFPYYRDLLTCLAAGLTPLEIILNGISKDTDVAGGGRHMSNHFAKPEVGIQNVSSCTGNHAQHAVGLARAVKTYGSGAVVFCSQGESSVSEGYVYEAVNGATREQLPVVFVIQDNGYGIAVPKSDQTANEDICDNFTGFLQPEDRQVRRQGPGGRHARHGRGPGLRAHRGRTGHGLCPLRAHRQPLQQRQARALPVPRGTGRRPGPGPHAALPPALPGPRRHRGGAGGHRAAQPGGVQRRLGRRHQGPQPGSGQRHPVRGARALGFGAVSPGPARRLRHPGEHAHTPSTRPSRRSSGATRTPTSGARTSRTGTRAGSSTSPRACSRSSGASGCSTAPSRRTSSPAPPTASPASTRRSGWWWRGPSSPTTSGRPPSSSSSFPTNTGAPAAQYSPNVTIRLASGGYIGGGLYHSQNIEGFLTSIPGLRVVVPAFADDAAGLLRTCIRSQGREPVPGAQVPVQLRPGQGLRSAGIRRAVRQGAGAAGRGAT